MNLSIRHWLAERYIAINQIRGFSAGQLAGTDTQAEQALTLVADSLLVQQINNAAIAWLVANGAEEPEATLLTQRLLKL